MRNPLLVLVGVGGLLLGGCGLGVHHQSAAPTLPNTPSTLSTPTTRATTSTVKPGTIMQVSPAGEKPALKGLLDMGVQTPYQTGQPFPTIDLSSLNGYVGSFGGVVVNENWSQLEPSENQYDWAPLDASLSAVSSWNAQHPGSPLGVKLRIFAGHAAPGWVTAQSGEVTIVVHGVSVSIGRWWTGAFEDAWHNFQQALASQFDANPLVRQVSVSSCSSSTGEPFVISGSLISQQNLRAAGWTPQAQSECLSGALSDYSGWKHTPITFAFNPLPTGQGPDVSIMDQIMTQCATSASNGGPECIVGNNDLSPNISSSRYSAPSVQEIQILEGTANPPVVYFQTSGAQLVCQTINTGLSYHAQTIEVWSPNGNYAGFSDQSPSTLAAWNQALISGSTSVSC